MRVQKNVFYFIVILTILVIIDCKSKGDYMEATFNVDGISIRGGML